MSAQAVVVGWREKGPSKSWQSRGVAEAQAVLETFSGGGDLGAGGEEDPEL